MNRGESRRELPPGLARDVFSEAKNKERLAKTRPQVEGLKDIALANGLSLQSLDQQEERADAYRQANKPPERKQMTAEENMAAYRAKEAERAKAREAKWDEEELQELLKQDEARRARRRAVVQSAGQEGLEERKIA